MVSAANNGFYCKSLFVYELPLLFHARTPQRRTLYAIQSKATDYYPIRLCNFICRRNHNNLSHVLLFKNVSITEIEIT